MTPLPDKFRKNISEHFPEKSAVLISALEEKPASKALLYNPLHNLRPELSLPWNEWSECIDNDNTPYILDPYYHAGRYYSQEPSSAIVSFLTTTLGLKEGAYLLDVCAAPGGKSLNLLNALPDKGVLVSNEINAKRNSVLQEVLEKWGHTNKVITQNKPSELGRLNGLFDLALIDAPCSGEGMFRKSKAAIDQWSDRLIDSCAMIQKEIIENISTCIKEGGHIIYSTCTLNKHENEENAKTLSEFGFEELDLNYPDSWAIHKAEHGNYFLPGTSMGEGLYFAVFRKIKEETRAEPLTKSVAKQIDCPFFKGDLFKIKKDYFHLNKETARLFEQIQSLNIKSAGSKVLIEKNNHLFPAIEGIKQGLIKLPCVELTKEKALKYLRGESISSDVNGWVATTYGGMVLGAAKGTGQRLNNHYPKNWRIKRLI